MQNFYVEFRVAQVKFQALFSGQKLSIYGLLKTSMLETFAFYRNPKDDLCDQKYVILNHHGFFNRRSKQVDKTC